MKSLITTLLLLISIALCGQVPENEQWRYVVLTTSLHPSFGEPISLIKSQLKFRRADKLLIKQITPDKISGCIINATTDTITIHQNGAIPAEYYTEVLIEGKWRTFQTNVPPVCGMAAGDVYVWPLFYCNFEIERTTNGTMILPFRICIKTAKELILSNVIEISCSKEQFDLVAKPPKPFTY